MRKLVSFALVLNLALAGEFLGSPLTGSVSFVLGPSVSKITSDKVSSKWNGKGYSIGGNMNFDINSKFYVGTGLYYTYVKGKLDDKDIGYHYLKMPVLLGYRAYKKGDLKVSVSGGPYFGYLTDNIDNDNIAKWDYGLRTSLNVKYQAFLVKATYDFGLKDISKIIDTKKTRSFSIGVGYSFNF